MSKAENLFKEAFERLKTNTPINVPKGASISQNNVAKEAGKHPTALKKDRFPLLVLEIQDYIRQQNIDSETLNKKKHLRKQRRLEDRFVDCKKQRDKLASICEAQAVLIEQLRNELSDCENGKIKLTRIP